MVGIKSTKELPAFPEDLPIADIPRLSLAKLLAHDANESITLYNSCKEYGFFLLDLSDAAEGRAVLVDVDNAFSASRFYFNLPLEEKLGDSLAGRKGNIGYKPTGVMPISEGKKDVSELLSISKESIFDVENQEFPAALSSQRPVLTSYCDHVHPLANLLLEHLAKHLGVSPSTLMALHDPTQPSATNVRLIHNPPQLNHDRHTSLPAHTDGGSITILFTRVGGLQLLPPGADGSQESAWRWVKPQPGCAIINIGDSMLQWTGGLLKSAFHRVQYAPGAQANLDRYSMGYFLKPFYEATMECIDEGDVIPRASRVALTDGHRTYAEWQASKTKTLNGGVKAASTGIKA